MIALNISGAYYAVSFRLVRALNFTQFYFAKKTSASARACESHGRWASFLATCDCGVALGDLNGSTSLVKFVLFLWIHGGMVACEDVVQCQEHKEGRVGLR
jgi:hypothetical protein